MNSPDKQIICKSFMQVGPSQNQSIDTISDPPDASPLKIARAYYLCKVAKNCTQQPVSGPFKKTAKKPEPLEIETIEPKERTDLEQTEVLDEVIINELYPDRKIKIGDEC